MCSGAAKVRIFSIRWREIDMNGLVCQLRVTRMEKDGDAKIVEQSRLGTMLRRDEFQCYNRACDGHSAYL